MSHMHACKHAATIVSAITIAASSSHAQTTGVDSGIPRPFEVSVRSRLFLIPERVVDGVTLQPTIGLSWSPLASLRLTLDAQSVDNSGPGTQGRFAARRIPSPGARSGNFVQEIALATDWGLWRNDDGLVRLALKTAFSHGNRSYTVTDSLGAVIGSGNRESVIPSGALALEGSGERFAASLGFAAVAFARHDAAYLRALPGEPRTFGVVLGPELAITRRLTIPFSLWGRVFAPISGNNTIVRSRGRPGRAVVYDAGVRLHVNEALSADVFLSNALGNTGALGYSADREYRAIGSGLSFNPGVRSLGTRVETMTVSGDGTFASQVAPINPGHLRRGDWWLRAAGGSQGVLTSAGITPVDALELGAFLDASSGRVNEGELGTMAKLLLLDPSRGKRASLGAVVAISRTNNPMINLLAGRRDELDRLGLDKGGFHFGDENEQEGRVYVITAALPIQWRLGTRGSLRAAPVVATAQRSGVQIAGIVVGGSRDLNGSFVADASVGVDAGSKGNVVTADGREHVPVWRASLLWHPYVLRSRGIALDGYVTNQIGDSPFHALRARADGDVAVGAGLRFSRPRE
jgi:hypothetical protein